MFTDVVDSTELLTEVGDDEAADLRRRHFRLLRAALAASGGTEVKSLGDGLMVVFDSAVDAVACAVRMQQAVDRARRGDAGRASLALRIGLDAGEPVRDEDDYFGTPVVVAKRLCDRAKGGQVLASSVVAALVGTRGGFSFAPLGDVELKGLREPVAAVEVGWLPVAPLRVSLPAALNRAEPWPFVGRDLELKRLRELLDAARAGMRQLVLLAGEPGIGKSRLAAELGRRAHDEGAAVLVGHCDEEPLVPYQPFVEALRHLVLDARAEDLRAWLEDDGADLVRLVPELADRFPDVAPTQREPGTERYSLFRAVARFLARVSEETPIVLVLDDLHWADRPTLLLLSHLVQAEDSASILLLGTYRDTDLTRSHPLAALLADLRRERRFDRLCLAGLEDSDVAALLEARTQVPLEPARLALAQALRRESEGNPFFVGELIDHLVESGAIDRFRGRWTAVLPESVKEVVGRRLSRLTDEANRALVVAAVIGREVGLELLEAVSGTPAGKLAEALEAAVDTRILVQAPGAGDRYRFVHDLVRDALYEQLSAARRYVLHRRIAEAIEELYADDIERHVAPLAYHLTAAAHRDTAEKAVEYATRAGDQALAVLAYEEAALHYERALQVLDVAPADDARRRCALLVRLADAQRRAGELTRSRETYAHAAELAREHGDPDVLARIALGFAGQWGEAGIGDHETVVLLEEALDGLGSEASVARVALLTRLAEELYYTQHARLQPLSEEAVRTARQTGDASALAAALFARHIALFGAPNTEERLALAHEIVRLGEESGDLVRGLGGRVWRLVDLLELGDVAAVDAEIADFAELAERLRLPSYTWYFRLWQAMRALLDGRLDVAERLSFEAAVVGRETRGEVAERNHEAQMLALRFLQGRLDELDHLVERLARLYPALAFWQCGRLLVDVECGRTAAAREVLDGLAADGFAAIPRDYNWPMNAALLAEVCVALDAGQVAERLYPLVVPFAGRWAYIGYAAVCIGSLSRSLGVLATMLGRWDEAEAHFASARHAHGAAGARPWSAFTAAGHAHMLRARARGGDVERAAALLAGAERIALELRLGGLQRRIAGLARA